MEMEEKHKHNNPKSHKRLRKDPSKISWSEIPQDLLTLVLERLGFTDFKRAKSVCSSWYSISKHCAPKNKPPWLILFPEDEEDKNSCTLFNLEEKDKLYKTQDLGLDFTKSICMTTYGSWFLMRDHLCNLYIVNLFTEERITLPPVESERGTTHLRSSHVFWIDEETKDYIVIWTHGDSCVLYAKKGDTSWSQIPAMSCCSDMFYQKKCCLDMLYKDLKLYFVNCKGTIIIFDFAGKIPLRETSCHILRKTFHRAMRVAEEKLVVTLSGDVLMVERLFMETFDRPYFGIYKVYSSRFFKGNDHPVDSLGDEAMLFDLGITVLANDIQGLQRNCIYFNGSNGKNTNEIRLFNLETQKMELLHEFDCSPVQLSKARWFVPSFKSH